MIEPLSSDIFQRGQILNNTYEIEGVLGRGGTGEVYRARNQISGRIVAIKALNARFSGNADYIELMKREEEMRNILNDAVVRYTECSRTDEGHVFLVMDFIDGSSLNDLMLSRRMDARELIIIAHRVAEGLAATHSHGIVHRDMSPDNIILRDGNPEAAVIIDFGIAKDTATGARTIVGNEFAGKYEYAAPEQLDGHAEPRSDLYSLGASLLAAYRGEVPFAGATPGEIVRRKQTPLDTDGVPEPLRGLIDWLTAHDIEDRPADAAAFLERLGQELKPVAARRRTREARDAKPRRRAGLIFGLVFLVAAVAAAYFSGLLGDPFRKPLPAVSPYSLIAEFDPSGAGSLAGNAPDKQAESLLRAAFREASGADPGTVEMQLATGMPLEDWPQRVGAALALLSPLQHWRAEVSDTAINVSGLAPDIATRDAVSAAFAGWANDAQFDLYFNVAAGPKTLAAIDIQPALAAAATCGPLSQAAGDDAVYALSDTITITGNVMSATDTSDIEQLLAPVIGDRKLRFATTALNSEICEIRDVLPVVSTQNVSIWLGDGETGAPNLSGIFTVGQNPIVEIQVPSDITTGSLWVMIVDTDGEVYHILPNINHTEHALSELGVVEGGVRRIRVLHSVEAFMADQSLRAFRISEGDFGKSEVIAILSSSPLFDMRRPGTESVTSVAEALREVLQDREGDVIGVATRIIDARR